MSSQYTTSTVSLNANSINTQKIILEDTDILDLIQAGGQNVDISLPTLSSRWDNDFAENLGWVKSEGQWLNGNSYPDAYQMMVQNIGLNDKFIAATEGTALSNDNYDKFLVDTTAVKFRLPLSNGERTLVKKYVNGTEWYNIYSDGWCEQGGQSVHLSSTAFTIRILIPYKDANYSINNQTGFDGYYTQGTAECFRQVWSVTNNSFDTWGHGSGTGLGYHRWATKGYTNIISVGDYNTGSYLYYKLGDVVPSTVVNTQQIVDDLHAECLEFKQEVQAALNQMAAYVVETWHEGTEWYRKYSDGWIEQGGTYISQTTGGSTLSATLSLHTPFSNKNYVMVTQSMRSSTINDYSSLYAGAVLKDTSSVQVKLVAANGAQYISGFMWYACGY